MPTTCGSADGRGGDARPRRRRAARSPSSERARRRRRGGDPSRVGLADRQAVDAAVAGGRSTTRPLGEEREAPTGRTPSAGSRCPAPRSTIELARRRRASSGSRLQNPVRSAMNHSEPSGAHVGWPIDSRALAAGDHRARAALVDHEARGVPRHVGVVPLEPAEGAAVGPPPRVGHEVGPATRRPPGSRRLVGGEPHDRVGRLVAVGAVLLLHAQQRGAVRAARRRRRSAGPAAPSGSGVSGYGLAARARAGGGAGWPSRRTRARRRAPTTRRRRTRARRVRAFHGAGSTSVTRAVGAAAQDRDAAALLGPALRPPHVVAVGRAARWAGAPSARPARS